MNETQKTNHCERAGELVAYFYGEATRDERASFDAHLARCGACREELTAFAGVREAVGHWRAEILDHAPAAPLSSAVTETPREPVSIAAATRRDAPAAAVLPQRTAALPRRAAAPSRAALAALREFFTLSPMWLRAGVAAAALAVCALAALAVVNAEVRWDDGGLAFSTRLRQTETREAAPPPAPVAAPAGTVYSQAELDKLVAERDAALRELEDTRAQLDDSRGANLIAAVETLEPASAAKTIQTPNNSRRERRAAPAPAARPRRLRNNRDEEDVPRLYDLLIEAN
jgi:hypothetical protein